MQRWLGLWLSALAALALALAPAWAEFSPSTMGDFEFKARDVCYRLSPALANDPKWSAWINLAFTNWNSVSGKTGWSFRPCAAGETPDIRIDTVGAAASAQGSYGSDSRYDMHIKPDVTGERVGPDGSAPISGGDNGWGTSGATTLDPVLVIMHEITHIMRMDHTGTEGYNAPNTPLSDFYFERPVAAGVHAAVISAKDIEQAHLGATTGKPLANIHYPLPPCFDDEAARAKAVKELNDIIGQLQDQIDEAAKAVVTAKGAELARVRTAGRQATSNLEEMRMALKAAQGMTICTRTRPSTTTPTPADKPDDNSHGMRPTATPGGAGAAFAAVIDEINKARAAPAEYARGLGAPPETVAYLQAQAPLPPLVLNDALATAASRHVADQGPSGGVSHIGRDGSTVRTRVNDAGLVSGIVAEEMSLGQSGARAVVRQLIIDDGYPNHPHRADLFSANLKYAGAACGPHAKFRTICVIDLSGAIIGR